MAPAHARGPGIMGPNLGGGGDPFYLDTGSLGTNPGIVLRSQTLDIKNRLAT